MHDLIIHPSMAIISVDSNISKKVTPLATVKKTIPNKNEKWHGTKRMMSYLKRSWPVAPTHLCEIPLHVLHELVGSGALIHLHYQQPTVSSSYSNQGAAEEDHA